MLVMALLADLGCRGSCTTAHLCPNTENGEGEHVIYDREELDIWTVWVSHQGNPRGYKDYVYTPKGTSVTGVWKYARQQVSGTIHKILCKGWKGYNTSEQDNKEKIK
jgi:hypothetical protein